MLETLDLFISAKIEFKPGDLWVGSFWRRTATTPNQIDIWICVVPCLPLHLTVIAERQLSGGM